MRLIVELVLLVVGLVFLRAEPAVPKFDGLDDILSSTEFEQFISINQAQQLRNEILAILGTAYGEHWNVPDVAQALKQLVTQYVPQVNQMHIDWTAIARSTLNDVGTALSNILSGTLGGHLRKRDLEGNDLQLLSQLSIDKLAQIAEVATIPDRTIALAKLQQLLQLYFPRNRGRTGFDELAASLLGHLDDILPQLNQQTFPFAG